MTDTGMIWRMPWPTALAPPRFIPSVKVDLTTFSINCAPACGHPWIRPGIQHVGRAIVELAVGSVVAGGSQHGHAHQRCFLECGAHSADRHRGPAHLPERVFFGSAPVNGQHRGSCWLCRARPSKADSASPLRGTMFASPIRSVITGSCQASPATTTRRCTFAGTRLNPGRPGDNYRDFRRGTKRIQDLHNRRKQMCVQEQLARARIQSMLAEARRENYGWPSTPWRSAGRSAVPTVRRRG